MVFKVVAHSYVKLEGLPHPYQQNNDFLTKRMYTYFVFSKKYSSIFPNIVIFINWISWAVVKNLITVVKKISAFD